MLLRSRSFQKSRFDIELSTTSLHFVFLNSRHLVEDHTWPRFTMLGQSLGSMYLAWEAVSKFVPDLFIDTMGYAFTFHVVSLLVGVNVGAYVHYPTISTEMIHRVESRVALHNNSTSVSSSTLLTRGKLLYYRTFMVFYAFSLRKASFLMVNSSWTKAHIDSILFHDNGLLDILTYIPPLVFLRPLLATLKPAEIVYPPCDTRELAELPLEGRDRLIVSLAQFRPEKDHRTQLLALSSLLESHPEYRNLPVKMVLMGGSRNAGDAERVEQLRALTKDLHIEDYVEFVINAPFHVILSWLGKASIGLSTMVDEHFGINIVEFMAAGAVPVAHASGGPLQDIIVAVGGKQTGHHAKTPGEFAEAFHSVFQLSKSEDLALRQRARTWAVKTFSNEEFEKGWDSSRWKDWL